MSIGVNPLLSTGRLPHFNHSLAPVFHHFCHFSVTFTWTDAFIHPEHPFFRPAPHLSANFSAIFRIPNVPMNFSGFETLSLLNYASSENRYFDHNSHFFHLVSASFISIDTRLPISSGLFSLNKWPLLTLTGPPFYCSRRTRLNLSMLLLLIIGGIEVNPGPSSSLNLTFGMLNTRSVVNKAPLLQSLITDNDLSILAITETWVKSLTTEASKTIAAAIVGSRLDFCNSLLAGTSVSNLARLQRVQNTLARVVAQKPRFCHITPVLFDLHWLPVRHRISFNIATVTYRVLQFQQPSCFSHPTICTGASTPLFFIFVDMCSHM